MKKWKKRLIKEMSDLDKKMDKLGKVLFVSDNETGLTHKGKALLYIQFESMQTYYSILELRLDNG